MCKIMSTQQPMDFCSIFTLTSSPNADATIDASAMRGKLGAHATETHVTPHKIFRQARCTGRTPRSERLEWKNFSLCRTPFGVSPEGEAFCRSSMMRFPVKNSPGMPCSWRAMDRSFFPCPWPHVGNSARPPTLFSVPWPCPSALSCPCVMLPRITVAKVATAATSSPRFARIWTLLSHMIATLSRDIRATRHRN